MLWFVIFPGRDPAAPLPAWWQRLLRLHHHHVLAARAEGDATLVVDMLGRRLDITLHPQPIGEHIAGWLRKPGTWVLAIMGRTNTGPQLHGPMTCVTVVQAVLGVRWPFVLTPEQLKRRLYRVGARPVLPLNSGMAASDTQGA